MILTEILAFSFIVFTRFKKTDLKTHSCVYVCIEGDACILYTCNDVHVDVCTYMYIHVDVCTQYIISRKRYKGGGRGEGSLIRVICPS